MRLGEGIFPGLFAMKRLLIVVVVVALAPASWAYEPSTHEDMSENAVRASVLFKDAGLLTSLGIKDLKESFPNSKGDKADIIELVRNGTRFEDGGSRSVNHFYDPVHNVPLSVPLLTASMSPDWAMKDRGDVQGQDFSYKHARQSFYDALTKGTKDERDQNFGKVFETLGHIIHHIQDMAQPQHVRNDPHCDAIVPCLIPGALAGKYNPRIHRGQTTFSGPVSINRGLEFPPFSGHLLKSSNNKGGFHGTSTSSPRH